MRRKHCVMKKECCVKRREHCVMRRDTITLSQLYVFRSLFFVFRTPQYSPSDEHHSTIFKHYSTYFYIIRPLLYLFFYDIGYKFSLRKLPFLTSWYLDIFCLLNTSHTPTVTSFFAHTKHAIFVYKHCCQKWLLFSRQECTVHYLICPAAYLSSVQANCLHSLKSKW